MPLKPAAQARISASNRAFVAAALFRTQANWAAQQWLDTKNRYATNAATKRLQSDIKSKSGKPVQYQLCEYIAASTIVHCMDGWAYLGRALAAELHGDPHVARHLAYYAELRAAMSLLASEGIGVFDSVHAVLNADTRCECIKGNGRTHVFTWDAFDYWATTPRAATTLFSILTPGSQPMSEWLTHFGGTNRFLATEWLTQWGLDLKRIRGDRDDRNVASYRPTAFKLCGATPLQDTLQAVMECWRMCEPFGSSVFATIDRHLLRYALHTQYKANTTRSSPKDPERFAARVDRMLHHIAPAELTEDKWKQVLAFDAAVPPLLKDANSRDAVDSPRHSKQVIARAILLLRTATGSVQALLNPTNATNRTQLEFWWSALGTDRGLWSGTDAPGNFLDLWADVRESLSAVEDWLVNTAAQDCSYERMWQECAGSAAVMATTERIGLWGMGL